MWDRFARIAFERGALLGLVVLMVYLWLAPAHIVAGDNAEFSTLGALGGRAHPSGYPLYVLFLRAMSWLPLDSAAHRASVATALLAAIHVVVLHAACRAWGARAAAAAFTAAIFAGAPIVLRVHTEADVFALNSLVASAILLVAAPEGPLRGTRRAALLGLIGGLGLANNLTAGLLAPIGIWGVVRGAREASSWVAPLALALVAFVAGLLPYAYLFVAPDAASWGPVDSFSDLADMFLRKDYGYTSHLPGGTTIPVTTSLGAHAMLIGRTWLWVPLLVGLGALGLRCVRGVDRSAWWMLAASWVVCGPVFASMLHVETHGVGGYIGARMQILSAVVLAIPIAAGFEEMAERSTRVLSVRSAAIAAIAMFAALVAVALPRLARVHGRAVEAGVSNMLVAMPPSSIALVTSEDLCFGARYLQLARGVRPDVTVVCWAIATRDWYRERIAADGVPLTATSGGPASIAQAAALLATGRPLLVEAVAQEPIVKKLPNYPVGVLRRVLPVGTPLPPLGWIVDRQRALFEVFDLDHPRPSVDDDFAAVAHKRYAASWRDLSRALAAAGDREGAAAAFDVGRQLMPD
ncbi:MAG: DUF2723 domain-containing protein [Deltaproteobacteria bacterium]|nr:DUF2723 domain-containing protein [Deltaproteobacteria bacterium]